MQRLDQAATMVWHAAGMSWHAARMPHSHHELEPGGSGSHLREHKCQPAAGSELLPSSQLSGRRWRQPLACSWQRAALLVSPAPGPCAVVSAGASRRIPAVRHVLL